MVANVAIRLIFGYIFSVIRFLAYRIIHMKDGVGFCK